MVGPLGVLIWSLSTILIFDFGIVPTVLFFCFQIFCTPRKNIYVCKYTS